MGLLIAVASLAARVEAGPASPGTAPARMLKSDSGHMTFRVEVTAPSFSASRAIEGAERISLPGYDQTGNPGEPPAPSRQFLVALPPTGAYSVTSRIITAQAAGAHRLEPVGRPTLEEDEDMGPTLGEQVVWDEAVYRHWTPPAMVEAREPAYIRHQRVLPLLVHPVVYDPTTYDVSVATAIEIDVRFAATPARGAAVETPGPDAKDWDEMFGRLFVNPGQARQWRTPVPAPEVMMQEAPAAAVAPGAVKLHVGETGMYKVTAATVIAAGFPPGQPLTNLRLFRRTYNPVTFTPGTQDIAFTVHENPAGTAGTFDGGDLIVFYGRRLRDDPNQGDTYEQYSAYNVYWLEPSAGTRMSQRTPSAGFVTVDTTSASFPATGHFETDAQFRDASPRGSNDIYCFNTGFEAGPLDMPFVLNAVKPGTNVQLSAELNGQKYNSPSRTIALSLVNSKGEKTLDPAYPVTQKARRVFTAPIAAADVDVGNNRFRFSRPDASRTTVEIQLNWVEATYSSLYRARGDALHFNTGTLAGDTTVTVTGLSTASGLEMFDVTNPDAPVEMVLGPGLFQPGDGGLTLAFRETVPARRDFQLVPRSRMFSLSAGDVEPDLASSIIGSPAESGVDVLVVSHPDFISQMRQWTSYRRAQGYRVLLVDVTDVFDEFNGGVPSPVAVYRFARHFFERGNAGALVLVGDASEDNKHVYDDSGPNFVPTLWRIDNVASLALDEVVTVDKRFVKFPGPTGIIDSYPDMILGRLPVGSTGELEILLDKIFAYESPSASDFWRKRMIIVADDTYSEGGSSFGGAVLCDNPGEAGFESGQENTAQIIENSLPAGYQMVRFYLRNHTSIFYTTQCANRYAALQFTRRNVTELLMGELDQGATLFTVQAHMSRTQLTHEALLSTQSGSVLGSTGSDHLRLQNRAKPWIAFGLGCHFSDFAVNRELSPIWASDANSPNGDAIGEQFLFQRERGAVASYGSTGFEYLSPNVDYMNRITQVWFYDAPYDTMINQTQAEWKLGQLMFLAETQLAGSQPDPVERYQILGDPLLRIDAGPPNFEVTVNGRPFQNGNVVEVGGEGDTLRVVATVTDENAIRKFSLMIDGVDRTDSLRVEPLVDQSLPRSRQYRLSFSHKLRPDNYDIRLLAYQAPDTIAGEYHLEAEFVLRVESNISVSVNDRAITSGASVPADGRYRVDLRFPVFIPSTDIGVFMDEAAVTNATIAHSTPDDSLAWAVTFRRSLSPGKHVLRVSAAGIESSYRLLVSDTPGLDNVINYPNPFRADGTTFVYSNDSEIVDGSIDIFTVSGKRVRRVDIPPFARLPGQNAVFWDGRDGAGGALANGTYLYVIQVNQRGGSATVRGKMSKLQ